MQMLATIVTVVAGVYLAACVVVLERRTAGYRPARNTISELGEIGAPYHRVVAFGVFLPVGMLLLLAAILLYPSSRAAAALAGCIATGYIVAAFFPCDPGSPISGSARQGMHNLGGAIEYLGGGAALFSIARTQGDLFRMPGFLAFAAALLLTVLPGTSVRGLVQRVAEAGLFSALAVVAARLYGGA